MIYVIAITHSVITAWTAARFGSFDKRPLASPWVLISRPRKWCPLKRAVEAGGIYASQSALEQTFGLGDASNGVVDVQWPGGVRNRLYDVVSTSRLQFPEIPCSIDDSGMNLGTYTHCVNTALKDLRVAKIISPPLAAKFLVSAITAWKQEHQ